MYSLREVLAQAQAAGTAIGHFNVADLVLLKAVFSAARELKVPVARGIRFSDLSQRGPYPFARQRSGRREGWLRRDRL